MRTLLLLSLGFAIAGCGDADPSPSPRLDVAGYVVAIESAMEELGWSHAVVDERFVRTVGGYPLDGNDGDYEEVDSPSPLAEAARLIDSVDLCEKEDQKGVCTVPESGRIILISRAVLDLAESSFKLGFVAIDVDGRGAWEGYYVASFGRDGNSWIAKEVTLSGQAG